MTGSPYLEELRLTAFKSFRDAVLPLREVTLLIGRNGGGKSNAIDALHVLNRLAEGEDLREAVDGTRRDGFEVRGGINGCAPYGSKSFALGCTVVAGEDRIKLDVEVSVQPDVQIVKEELVLVPRHGHPRKCLSSEPPQPGLADISARYYNGKKGPNPAATFRSDRLLTAQVPARIPATGSTASRTVQQAAAALLDTLRGVFILDPVPHLMRQYVPERDMVLRRRADNLSAVIGALRSDPQRWIQLKELTQSLAENEVCDITVETSNLGDVMLALLERFNGKVLPVSARTMSDGMLRFLAFAAALLEPPLLDEAPDGAPHTLLVIEEIENGLHPSQAARVIHLIKSESRRRCVRTLATTHSPAMLNALDAADHEGVIICRRTPKTAFSELIPLVELPGYPEAMAAGSLGEAVTQRRLDEVADRASRHAALERMLATV